MTTTDAKFKDATGFEPGDLRLLAQDTDDLSVIASLLQDSIIAVGKMHFDANAHTFIAQVSRFIGASHHGSAPQRVQSLVRFDCVLSARGRGLSRQNPDALAVLLSVSFEAGEAPGGKMTLTFAGDGEMQLAVEDIEVRLMDISRPYKAKSIPEHGLEP